MHNGRKPPGSSASEVTAVQAPWKNLQGPPRLIAQCATVLLVASGMLGVEAGIMIILGPARDLVIKPFVILGYLEVCAIFFSVLALIAGILGSLFYRPYRMITDKIFLYRAHRARPVTDKHTYFEELAPAPFHNPEEDGAPD